MADRFTIVGIGEALYDIFPEGERLGGAPLNTVVCAHQLAQVRGGRAVLVSRVGQDELGERALAELQQRGLDIGYIETDPDRATGRVYVDLDENNQPEYEIVRDVAWDVLQYDPDLEDLAMRCEAVCFGSLAQRDAQSRNSIYRFLDTTRRATILFDVNLRKPFYDRGVLQRSCERATIVKLNEDELHTVTQTLGVDDDPDALRSTYNLDMLVVTRGDTGTRLHTKQGTFDGEPAHYEPADNADPVGAGDASSAAILLGKVLRWPPQKTADLANHCGAYVASQPGATPDLPESILDMLKPGA